MFCITPRYTHSNSRALTALLLLLLISSLIPIGTGCSSPEDRSAYHLERGRAFSAEGKNSAARIEFLSALSFDSDNLAAHLELADFAEARQNLHDAKFYLREGLRVDPMNNEINIRLAVLLRDEEPWRARQMLMMVLERDPQDAVAQLGLSHIELSVGRPNEALTIIERAIEIDPDIPGSYWQLGTVYEVMLERANAEKRPIDETVRRGAVEAFDNFLASGGEPEWKARFEQARVLATGSHNRNDALAGARRALDSARKTLQDQAILITAQHLANVARIQNDRAAYAESIEARLEITPRDFRLWRKLAELRENSGGSAEKVYQDLFAVFPDDPEVHILYARHIGTARGVWVAIRYFEEQIERGIDGAQLLSALRSYQLTVKLKPQAGRSLSMLVERYPDDPFTQLEVAKELAAEGRSLAAISSLEELTQGFDIPEAFEVLAKLERFHHRPLRAIASARKAVDGTSYYEARLHRLLAETLLEGGFYGEYLDTLEVIAKYDGLTQEQRLLKARALYLTDKLSGRADEGRRILLELIEDPTTSAAAAIEFARHEIANPDQQQLARKLLRTAMWKDPKDRDLIVAMINANFQSGRPKVALRMLDQLVISEYPASVRYLRARLRAVHGSEAAATLDLDLALRADPLLPSVIDFALAMYSRSGELDRHIDKLLGWIQTMRAKPHVDWLTNSRRITQLHLLHSRLLQLEGRPSEAITVLEAAISKHEYSIDSRIDLAYLLALTETDIERAIDMGIEIVAKRKSGPRALDTLGFAYLRDGKPLEASKNFRLANYFSETPNPKFRFHESVALRQLGREREALDLIEGVLALDPGFPEAAEAQRSLRSSLAGKPSAS